MNRIRNARVSKKRVSLVAAGGTVLIGMVVAAMLASSAGAAGGGLHAKPAKALTTGETTTVTGKNLIPGDEIILIQCQRAATSVVDCNPATAVGPVKISATGRLPATTFTVMSGSVGTATCGTSTADRNGCEIAALDASSPTGVESFAAFVNIRFVKGGSSTTLPTLPTTLPTLPTT
ncbi:MAG: neocarzinostatin apoprotein domain-containing protein, partial [Acidimicrobiales bacterium]